jgi:hypothetical protein
MDNGKEQKGERRRENQEKGEAERRRRKENRERGKSVYWSARVLLDKFEDLRPIISSL